MDAPDDGRGSRQSNIRPATDRTAVLVMQLQPHDGGGQVLKRPPGRWAAFGAPKSGIRDPLARLPGPCISGKPAQWKARETNAA